MKTRSYLHLMLFLSAAIILVTLLLFSSLGWSEDTMRLLIKWSAKISATLFSIAFGASAFHYFYKDDLSALALKYRPNIGLAFVVFHSFHLLFLIGLQYWFHPVFELAKRSSLLGGGLAYVFMCLMMITTFPRFKAKILVSQWRWLHLAGGYWIWLIFFRSYLKRVLDKQEEIFLFSLLLSVLLLRLLHLLFKYRKRRAFGQL